MAENDKDNLGNDEYQFDELNDIEGTNLDEDATSPQESLQMPAAPLQNDVRRNALIVVGGFIVLVLLYKFVGLFFSSKEVPKDKLTPPVSVQTPQVVPITAPIPVEEAPPEMAALKQTLDTLQIAQGSVRNDVDSVANQLATLNSNMAALTAKMEALTATLNTMATKVDNNTHQIAMMHGRIQAKGVKHAPIKATPRVMYYIQAIIPGRAWLISSNGTTLTVRDGTIIPGFGTVRIIDPSQGRVVTSSGVTIRFNQQDS